MKIHLNLDDLRFVRDAMYDRRRRVEKEIEEKPQSPAIRDLCEEHMAQSEKLIAYLNEIIRKEEP